MISNMDIARVARQHDIPHWLAAGLAADVVLGERIRADRNRPRLERAQNRTAFLAHIVEREEREREP